MMTEPTESGRECQIRNGLIEICPTGLRNTDNVLDLVDTIWRNYGIEVVAVDPTIFLHNRD